MITTFQFLGIYEDAVNKASKSFDNALEKAGASDEEIDNAWDQVKEVIAKKHFGNCPTNAIIETIYVILERELICRGYESNRLDFFINCDDSHFYIDNEEII